MKYFLTFTAGILIGAAGSIIWLRKDFQDKLNEAEGRIKEANKQNDKKKVEEESKNKKNFVKRSGEINKKRQVREYNKILTEAGYNTENGNDSSSSAKEKDGSQSDLNGSGEASNDGNDISTESSKEAITEPYGISDQEYIHTYKEEYDKVDLYYYTVDKVLCEEDGTVIENDIYCLGENWQEYIGKFDEDTAYIRNERISTDFCVTCEDLSYEEEYGE